MNISTLTSMSDIYTQGNSMLSDCTEGCNAVKRRAVAPHSSRLHMHWIGSAQVDRAALRDVLIDSLAPGGLHWGSALTGLQPADAGGYVLSFSDGSTEHAAVVVGADGASSRVRPLLSDATPQYCGVSSVEVGLPDADAEHPALAELVGRGSMFALGDDKGLIAQRNGDGRIRVYVCARAPAGWLDAFPCADRPAEAREMLAAEFSDWAPQLVDLITCCDDRLVPRRITRLPVEHQWESLPGITLLGDAAHLMPPFAGEGANLAMLDALELAEAIVQGKGLSEYETAMFERSQAAAEQSMQGLDMCISDGCSAQRFADFMANMVGPPPEQAA